MWMWFTKLLSAVFLLMLNNILKTLWHSLVCVATGQGWLHFSLRSLAKLQVAYCNTTEGMFQNYAIEVAR